VCKGCGWLLQLVDLIASEYSWTLTHVLNMPVNQLFILRLAIAQRNGVELDSLSLLEVELMDVL